MNKTGNYFTSYSLTQVQNGWMIDIYYRSAIDTEQYQAPYKDGTTFIAKNFTEVIEIISKNQQGINQ